MNEVQNIKDMPSVKAFEMIVGEIEGVTKDWSDMHSIINGSTKRWEYIIENTSELAKRPSELDSLKISMRQSHEQAQSKMDSCMEKVAFILHIGGTCKSLESELKSMIINDMQLISGDVQDAEETLISINELSEDLFKLILQKTV